MSYTDSLSHPRVSTLATGWAMEATVLDDTLHASNDFLLNNAFPQMTRATTSSSSSAASTSESYSTGLSRQTSATSFPSSDSGHSKPGPIQLPSLGPDKSYKLSVEISAKLQPRRLRKRSHSRIRSPDPSRSATPDSTKSKQSASTSETTAGRGRKITLKGLGLRSTSKSKERGTRTERGITPEPPARRESIPPVPVLNLPIAEKFMKRTLAFAPTPPPIVEKSAFLSTDLWNQDTLLPSAATTTFPPQDVAPHTITASRSGSSSPSSTPTIPYDQIKLPERIRMTAATATVVPIPIQPQIPFEAAPLPPVEPLQPKSFLSMSTSTVNLLDAQIKPAKKKKSIARRFLIPLAPSSKNVELTPPQPTVPVEKMSKPKKELFALTSALITTTTSLCDGPPTTANYRGTAHFSYIEVDMEEAQPTPMSWIEVPLPEEEHVTGLSTIPQSAYIVPSPTAFNFSQLDTPQTNYSDLSEYEPYNPVPASALFSQPIPTIQRGRETPFPQRPILPPSSIPRLRVMEFTEIPRYKNILISNRVPQAIQELDIVDDKSIYPDEEKTRYTAYTAISTPKSYEGWRPIMDEHQSREARERFEEAVGKLLKEGNPSPFLGVPL